MRGLRIARVGMPKLKASFNFANEKEEEAK